MELIASTSIVTRDYKGTAFQFREDGYFNMTKAAKHFGKRLDNFIASPDTVEYLAALANSLDSRELLANTAKSADFLETVGNLDLFHTKMGRNGGTWGHPKLAVFFARWLDVKFAVWCDMVIDDLLRGKAELTITKPAESAVMALPSDYSAALRALADSVEQQEKIKAERDHAIATKAEIGHRREATAMAKASAAVRKANKLEEELGRNQRHATVIAVERATGRRFPHNAYVALRRWTNAHGMQAVDVMDPRYGTVKAWPAGAWEEAYGIILADLFAKPANDSVTEVSA